MDILEKIQNEIKHDYYQQNYPNDGQRFVAWYMRNIHLLDALQARDSITDGANDKQIDAVYIDDDEQKVFIVQGKYYLGASINAEPVREVISSWTQLRDLVSLQEGANDRLKIKLNEISKAINEDDYNVCFELITTSEFTEEAQKDIAAFQATLSSEDASSYDAELVVVDKNGLDDKYTQTMEKDNPSLNHTINLEDGKYLYTTIGTTNVCLTAMPLKECIKFPGISNGTLFQKNVRQSLGISNAVNKKIRKTITGDKCGDFFFFHNGITAICNKMELVDGKLIVHGVSVVNGCQSLNTILSCSEVVKKRDDAYVLFRFYEIPQKDRADSISINTNTQSAVKTRDLRSNDKRVIRLKKAYEQKYYPFGFFAAKRGDQLPADKSKDYFVELSYLGKFLIAWYSQRPNLSYGETKIFDKYFDTLFKKEYKPEDIYALNYWYNKIMSVWTEDNPLSIHQTILTMKAYAPYHFLFTISSIVAKLNGKDSVPSPYQCLVAAQNHNMVDTIISIVANCMNNAYAQGEENAKVREKPFIPQNWVKNKESISAIQGAVNNFVSFLPAANRQMFDNLKEAFAIDPSYFEYRLAAD